MSQTQNKIIAALDFSENSLDAAELAAVFCKKYGAELILLYVMEVSRGLFGLTSHESQDEAVKAAANGKLDELLKKYSGQGLAVSKMITKGNPYKEITDTAESVLAKMIFMGTAGIATMGEIFLGSTAGRVARSAPCPIVTVRYRHGKNELKRIAVSIDPEFGVRSIRNYFENIPSFRPDVHLICVSTDNASYRSTVEARLKEEQALFEKLGFANVTTEVLIHDVISSGILAYAEKNKENIDLMLMETHARTGLSAIFIGSITEEVISFSPIPLFSARPTNFS